MHAQRQARTHMNARRYVHARAHTHFICLLFRRLADALVVTVNCVSLVSRYGLGPVALGGIQVRVAFTFTFMAFSRRFYPVTYNKYICQKKEKCIRIAVGIECS